VPAAGPVRWGYHRLTDQWAARLVDGAHIRAGDLVLDVGAGSGALTAPLVEAGARVVAIELHAERARSLRARFAGSTVKVVRADAADLRLPGRPFRVVANPPFGVSTALLRRLLSPGSRLVSADLVLPLHVARRWTSPSAPGYNRWCRSFDVRVIARLPRNALTPAPPLQVAILRIERAWQRDRHT
jgi:23S rRNA (adenine-N6)-dimethyltransferase